MPTDRRIQPPLEGGITGGLVEIGAKLSDLKQSVRVAIRWLHGPQAHQVGGRRFLKGLLESPDFLPRYLSRPRPLLPHGRAGENSGQSVVALVAGIFVDSTLRRGELILAAPRLFPHRRILDGELIE